jgi:hypothetical protein
MAPKADKTVWLVAKRIGGRWSVRGPVDPTAESTPECPDDFCGTIATGTTLLDALMSWSDGMEFHTPGWSAK